MGHLRIWKDAILAEFPEFPGFDRLEGWVRTQSPEGLRSALAEPGLDQIQIYPLAEDWPFPAPLELLSEAHRNLFLDAIFRKLGPGSETRVRSRLLDQLQARYGNAPFSVRSEALCGVGRVV